ncbi:unnamed protein product, partial [Vitis vinifera]|uniref:Uncharacterized protein n=1 Tax=Vitis vinifera TaxID=29760 RepID=D7TYE0_VITVI
MVLRQWRLDWRLKTARWHRQWRQKTATGLTPNQSAKPAPLIGIDPVSVARKNKNLPSTLMNEPKRGRGPMEAVSTAKVNLEVRSFLENISTF